MKRLLSLLLLTASPVFAPALAQETITVSADPVRLLDDGPTEGALGLGLSLSTTPRAATQLRETTLARYGVTGLDDLTAITPNAYTASFYGVEGAVNLRGTLAENYFRGFKRAENRGTYSTPLQGEITILRGPPTPVMGAGKVGGMVDFAPAAVTENSVTLTYGAYEKRSLAAQGGIGVALGDWQGRLSAHAEVEDSYSFYRGLHPRRQNLSLGADLSNGDWSLSADYLFFHADGEVQTPGWNRLTQNLIDTGTYITGRNTSLRDADGNGRLTLDELGGNPYYYDPAFRPLAIPGGTDAAHRLDSGFGTTRLSRRTVHVSRQDFSRTDAHTGFLEVRREVGGDTLRLQLFGETLGNDRFVSYGFPAATRSALGEARLRYDFDRAFGGITAHSVAGLSYRHVQARDRQSFNSGIIALDRRDISQGAAPNDIFDSPFTPDAPGTVGLGWESDLTSTIGNAGAFLYSDLAHGPVHLLLGGRYDHFTVRSRDAGVLAYAPPTGRDAGGRFSFSASLSFQSDSGLTPYITHARSNALEVGQAGEVPTSLLVGGGGWASVSTLDEAGVKFAGSGVEASLSFYRQARTQLSQLGGVSVTGTRGEGVELDVRWLIDDHVSATLAASLARTTIKGPDRSFAYVPARTLGVDPQNGFGGSYIAYDFSAIKGAGDYDNTLMPKAVISPALTYTGTDWGAVLAATYVGQTRQTVPDPVVFPAYVTLNASAFIRWDSWRAAINLDNALDARFFTPDADIYANLGALPGMGRRWRVSLTRTF